MSQPASMNTEPNNQPERVEYIVSPPAPGVNIERDEDMEAKAYIIFDEDHAAHVGGHFGIVVYFDQEPEAEISQKVLEAVRTFRGRVAETLQPPLGSTKLSKGADSVGSALAGKGNR